jgi:hypothetical protein
LDGRPFLSGLSASHDGGIFHPREVAIEAANSLAAFMITDASPQARLSKNNPDRQ